MLHTLIAAMAIAASATSSPAPATDGLNPEAWTPPGAALPAAEGYFAESPWEFGAPGVPTSEPGGTLAVGASSLLPDAGTHAAPVQGGCGLCCTAFGVFDQVCLGGFISNTIRNTVYFASLGAICGCFGGIILGLIPVLIVANLVPGISLGGLVLASVFGCGGVGCVGGAGAMAPLGFYWAALFPNWDPTGGRGPQQQTVIIDGNQGGGRPPYRDGDDGGYDDDDGDGPSVEHRPGRRPPRRDSGRDGARDDDDDDRGYQDRGRGDDDRDRSTGGRGGRGGRGGGVVGRDDDEGDSGRRGGVRGRDDDRSRGSSDVYKESGAGAAAKQNPARNRSGTPDKKKPAKKKSDKDDDDAKKSKSRTR